MTKPDYKHFKLVIFSCTLALLIIILSPYKFNPKEIVNFNNDSKNYNAKLQIFENDKKIATFFVAIADDDKKRMYGLMNLKKLPKNQGMLFAFQSPRMVNMWMKNTKIPLDMLFIDDNNIIVKIHEKAQPESLDLIDSAVLVNKALEINAGMVKKYKIKKGQKIKITTKNVKFFK